MSLTTNNSFTLHRKISWKFEEFWTNCLFILCMYIVIWDLLTDFDYKILKMYLLDFSNAYKHFQVFLINLSFIINLIKLAWKINKCFAFPCIRWNFEPLFWYIRTKFLAPNSFENYLIVAHLIVAHFAFQSTNSVYKEFLQI